MLEEAATDLVVATTALNGPKAEFRINGTPATMIAHRALNFVWGPRYWRPAVERKLIQFIGLFVFASDGSDEKADQDSSDECAMHHDVECTHAVEHVSRQ